MTEPLSIKYLDRIRSSYAGTESTEGRIINELLDEIEELDATLRTSEDEVERLRAQAKPQATPSGKWRARWRDKDGQHSKMFDRPAEARSWARQMGGRVELARPRGGV
ncbi:hypothetical protein [Kitasatospora sp. NPDC127116]|uniref:hypothetical protein n=1 Tax=Kitasatospora sp. NPDC127116 TaxID=3345367 RepID=UPI00362D7E8E